MITPRIEQIEDRLVVGMKTTTSIMDIGMNTKKLAQVFMPRRAEVKNRIGTHVFSIQDYGPNYNPQDRTAMFDKWVAVEVEAIEAIPNEMESFLIVSGTYAVFDFKGAVADFPKVKAYIFREWLPKSGYQLDQKVHFELLNEDYSKDLQNVEEEIWIPIIEV